MRTARAVLWHLVRALLAIAAVVNLVCLFIWSYNLPDSIQSRIDKIIYGDRKLAVEVLAPGEEPKEPEEPVIEARLVVPSQAINYSGGQIDILDGVYIEYPDGSREENPVITTEIEEGNTRLDKIVHYTATLEDGRELTGDRTLRINSRYTGPTLTVTGEIPEVTMDDDIRQVVIEQIAAGNIYAEDGFGNDITSSVRGRFDRTKNDDGETVNVFVLYVTNAVGDTAEVNTNESVYEGSGNGVVMRLTTEDLTLNAGTPFYYQDYIKDAHDSHGNDLSGSVRVIGTVNSYAVGEYSLEYYCVDADGKESPHRTLKVHIV